MIGEIDPQRYDCEGHAIPFPLKEGLPLRDELLAYLSGDLTVKCNSLGEIQVFLGKCRYVRDTDQFGVGDYWMRPQHFERARRGDCEDFALWTWRQLLAMGLEARLVVGRVGRGRHAWVTFSDSERHYIFEPTIRRRRKLSRLELLIYEPDVSISFHENTIVCYRHKSRDYRLSPSEALVLVVGFLPLLIFRLILLPWDLVKKAARLVWDLILQGANRRARRRRKKSRQAKREAGRQPPHSSGRLRHYQQWRTLVFRGFEERRGLSGAPLNSITVLRSTEEKINGRDACAG